MSESITPPVEQTASGLLRSALRLYVRKAEKDETEKKLWIKQPNNLISVVALALSISGVAWGFYKDWKDGIDKNMQMLSQVVADITKLDTEVSSFQQPSAMQKAVSPIADPTLDQQRLSEYSRSINNRRLVLLAEAERLVEELGTRAPHPQVGVLGTAFYQTYEYDTAKKYFLLMTNPPANPALQATAWRSVAMVNFMQGPVHYGDARTAFANAATAIASSTDFGAISISFETQQQWAQLEMYAQDWVSAADHWLLARKAVLVLPCEVRAGMVGPVERGMKATLAGLKSASAEDASAKMIAWNGLIGSDKCASASLVLD